jgi:hypothetical protein
VSTPCQTVGTRGKVGLVMRLPVLSLRGNAPPSRYGPACKCILYVSAVCESVCVCARGCAGALAPVRRAAEGGGAAARGAAAASERSEGASS